ncbi:MAG: hypothetical protein Q7T03_01015 [Deltaproteobacteria bacterium]|nr:hypothetical protein [Deltaproteobacteria bacterium]
MTCLPTTLPALAIGNSALQLTQEQFTSLYLMTAETGDVHPIAVFEKDGRGIIALGETHYKNETEATVMQRVVRAFPLKGVELHGVTEKGLNAKPPKISSPDCAKVVAKIARYRFGSGIHAAILEYPGRDDQMEFRKILADDLRSGTLSHDQNTLLTIVTSGYVRKISLDPSTALYLAGEEVDENRVADIFGRGFPLVLLELGHKKTVMDHLLNASFFLIAGGILFLFPVNIWRSSEMALGSAYVGLLAFGLGVAPYYWHLVTEKFDRDVTMARNSDAFMCANPPYPIMLSIMGSAHLLGYSSLLTKKWGWKYVGDGQKLFLKESI